QIQSKRLNVFVLDAYGVAKSAGMGGRINTVMQTAFFALSGVLPREEAIARIKNAIKKTYGRRGEAIVQKNYAAVDAALENLYELPFDPITYEPVAQHPVVNPPNDPATQPNDRAPLPDF